MILNKKVIRTMKEKKSQYYGSIILVAISCMLFCAFNTMGINITQNLKEFKKFNIQEDASFIVQKKLNNLETIEHKYNLKIEERNSVDYVFNKKSTLRILDVTEKIDKHTVIKGKDIKKPNEVIIDPGFAKAHDILIGQTLKFFDKNFNVVGFTSSPDYIYPLKTESDMVKNPNSFGIAIISKKDFKSLNAGFKFYSIKFNEENKSIQSEFKKYIENTSAVVKWIAKKDNMRINFIENDIKSIDPMGKVLPGAILLLTCVLVVVVLWRLLKKEFSQIGVLYAIGYKKPEIMRHYLQYPIFISLAGSLIGTTIGLLIAKPFLEYASTFYNLPVYDIKYDIKYLLFSFTLPLIFLLPSTFFIILKGLRLSPLELIRGETAKVKINFLEKNINLNKFKFNTKFKVREIIRNIPRMLLMILGVTFASMLLLLGFATKDSMDYLMNKSFDDTFKYKYDYMFSSIQTEKPKYGETVSLAPFTSNKNKKKDRTIVIYGIQKDSKLVKLKDSEGKVLDTSDVILTKALADELNVSEGDSFSVKSKITTKTFSLKVDKVADYYMGEFVYMPIDEFNELNGFPKGSYLELYSDEKLDIDAGKLISIIKKSDLIEGYKTMVEPMKYLIGLIGIVSFIIGLIVIYVVTSLVIEENRDNISLFKILGYSKKELYSLILNTNTIFVIIGYIISVPLVYYSTGMFFEAVTKDMTMKFPIIINSIDIFIGFAFIFVTYKVSKLLNRRKIIGISMADSLKNKME